MRRPSACCTAFPTSGSAGDDSSPASCRSQSPAHLRCLTRVPSIHASLRAHSHSLCLPDSNTHTVSQAGYRVICPDMRGYAASSKPAGIENYSEVAITGDVDALRKHFCGADGAFELLVGHDWGAAAAWGTMSWYPTLAKKLAILNVPHPKRFAAGLSTPQQLLKSWYVFAFQPPAIAEAGFAALNGELVRRVFTVDPDTPLEAWELDRYVEAASSGGMTGAINWYRAAGAGLWPANMPSVPAPLLEVIQAVQGVQGKLPAPPQGRLRSDVIECPVMILWGKRDPYLGQELARPPPGAVPDLRLHFLDATHWVHWDQHEAVTDYLLAFLKDAAAPNPLD